MYKVYNPETDQVHSYDVASVEDTINAFLDQEEIDSLDPSIVLKIWTQQTRWREYRVKAKMVRQVEILQGKTCGDPTEE